MVAMSATGTSAARVAANRANARKSTGPRTAAGKARSRANAVKHGLTGAGVALPTEDAAQVAQRFVEFQADMTPGDMLGRVLVQQMALMSVRIDRAARQEAARVGTAIRHAAVEFDLAQAAAVDRLIETIVDEPGENHRRLLTTTAGIDRLVEALTGVRDQLGDGQAELWRAEEREEIEAFFGRRRTFFPVSRTSALLEALGGDGRFLSAAERDQIRPPGTLASHAAAELARLLEAEIARLGAIRATIDPEVVAADRRAAADVALFDPGTAAANARRYEALATRNFHRALRDFRAHEAEVAPPGREVGAPPAEEPGQPVNRIAHLLEPTAPEDDFELDLDEIAAIAPILAAIGRNPGLLPNEPNPPRPGAGLTLPLAPPGPDQGAPHARPRRPIRP